MFFQALELTTASRPELWADETLLLVQDDVGLYEGKFKIPAYQSGHVYLTSHRVCYIDNAEPRQHSVAIELRDVDRYEVYVRNPRDEITGEKSSNKIGQAGFLKSSPKVTLFPKTNQLSPFRHASSFASTLPSRSASASPRPGSTAPHSASSPARAAPRAQAVTWVCSICSFSNTLPPNFDPTIANEHTPLPPCQACGIKPSLAQLLKAAIAGAAARVPRGNDSPSPSPAVPNELPPTQSNPDSTRAAFECPRCTFQNHPSLLECEICGASLVVANDHGQAHRPPSPGPALEPSRPPTEEALGSVKISFRAGGDRIFAERLKGALVQRKWLLQSAPPVPSTSTRPLIGSEPHSTANSSGRATPEPKAVGIAGLERRGAERRKNNEVVISSGFEDLDALMASAKEILALAESFAEKSPGTSANALLHESAALINMAPAKDLLGSGVGGESLYLSELSRNLAEYLTDDRHDVLRKEGWVMSIVDLWATFNRARNGIELVSAADFEKATELWAKLNLPVRRRAFKNGLLVVQSHDWTDDKVIAMLYTWFQDLRAQAPTQAVAWDWRIFGRGVTAQETAARFGWSVGVATEELEMAEEHGVLCREESIEGLKFWENWILDGEDDDNPHS